ncbi:response regulator, partial [Clostridium perfringens]|nr:response regulator [Clostridium perfringens]
MIMYKMLLVEDEPIVRLALKTQVNWQEYGFDEILEAADGSKALDIIRECKDIDIVITDINMPGINGMKLIEETKKFNNDIQFLVLSAYDDYEFVRKAFKLGIDDYTLKTEMDMEKILHTV